MKKKNRITAQERDLIALWRSKEVSLREIARSLGINPSDLRQSIYDVLANKLKAKSSILK